MTLCAGWSEKCACCACSKALFRLTRPKCKLPPEKVKLKSFTTGGLRAGHGGY